MDKYIAKKWKVTVRHSKLEIFHEVVSNNKPNCQTINAHHKICSTIIPPNNNKYSKLDFLSPKFHL